MKIILIAGGSGSGKTTISGKISEVFKNESVECISLDSYYKDNKNKTLAEKLKINYDHPDNIDINKVVKDLKDLKAGKTVDVPVYDFEIHGIKESETIKIKTPDVLILEGILTLHFEELRKLADIKIYIETQSDIRFIRRLTRDINERGRTIENVIEQYLATVKPMHRAYVKPSIHHADIIIPYYEYNDIAVDLITSKIKEILQK
ncbi:uridine kinase [Spiroplasma endosymbiont of Crioceris asparagi]|uniref:uridine kinase n=1 Tax=Spiroplasma endosymbiont of Crioceris asparagi TaxID=3066286 RepID=UPI0030D5C265